MRRRGDAIEAASQYLEEARTNIERTGHWTSSIRMPYYGNTSFTVHKVESGYILSSGDIDTEEELFQYTEAEECIREEKVIVSARNPVALDLNTIIQRLGPVLSGLQPVGVREFMHYGNARNTEQRPAAITTRAVGNHLSWMRNNFPNRTNVLGWQGELIVSIDRETDSPNRVTIIVEQVNSKNLPFPPPIYDKNIQKHARALSAEIADALKAA